MDEIENTDIEVGNAVFLIYFIWIKYRSTLLPPFYYLSNITALITLMQNFPIKTTYIHLELIRSLVTRLHD